jgi:hypothetical protein
MGPAKVSIHLCRENEATPTHAITKMKKVDKRPLQKDSSKSDSSKKNRTRDHKK